MGAAAAADLLARLDLSDDEVVRIFEASPLDVISGALDARPEVEILLALTAGLDEGLLRRWLRARGPRGRPVELLTAHDFAGFEDAALEFRERGIVLRSGLQHGSPPVD
ncbi:MAG: hypothetical protein ACR2ND_09400 [Solirubrobacteraceae bacterium]